MSGLARLPESLIAEAISRTGPLPQLAAHEALRALADAGWHLVSTPVLQDRTEPVDGLGSRTEEWRFVTLRCHVDRQILDTRRALTPLSLGLGGGRYRESVIKTLRLDLLERIGEMIGCPGGTDD